MSQQAENWFVEEYRSNVRHIYQSQGYMLKATVMPEGRVEGKRVYFPVAGKKKARRIVRRAGNATPQNPDRTQPYADLEDWQVFSEIDYLDINKMKVNERTVEQQEGAMALGRRADRIIVDAMGTSFPLNQTTGTGGDITLAAIMTAANNLFARGVPDDGNAFALLPYLWWNVLMTYKQFNSAEWVGHENLSLPKRTRGKFWNGINWLVGAESADDEDEALFTIPASNQFYSYMWHRNAIGALSNYEGQTFIDWDNRATCWTVNMLMQGCAKRILDKGVQRLHFASNTTITASA
jgi:hypothetical protein